MTLEEALKNIKPSVYISIIVNNKFALFNCVKSKMNEREHIEYIKGFEDLEVKNIKKHLRYSYNCVSIYVESDELENRCLRLENMWYNTNNNFMDRKEGLKKCVDQ